MNAASTAASLSAPGCPRFRLCALHPATPYRGSSTALGYGASWR